MIQNLKKKKIKKRDTLNNPPKYENKFVLTNPPYLARNKSNDKKIFDKYNQNDLYKCFIKELVSNNCNGGIIILPLNFWCSTRKNDIELRKKFIENYKIIKLNIFEEKVFNDTSYAICAFQFEMKKDNKTNSIKCKIFPKNVKMEIVLNNENNYTVGGEIYNLEQSKKITVSRITKNNKNNNNGTNILLKCIDDSETNKIGLSYVNDDQLYIDETPKLSARSYATLLIEPKIDNEKQKKLVYEFNNFINEKRKKYNSLFLSNYRESNSIARKRISFSLAFKIANFLLWKKLISFNQLKDINFFINFYKYPKIVILLFFQVLYKRKKGGLL